MADKLSLQAIQDRINHNQSYDVIVKVIEHIASYLKEKRTSLLDSEAFTMYTIVVQLLLRFNHSEKYIESLKSLMLISINNGVSVQEVIALGKVLLLVVLPPLTTSEKHNGLSIRLPILPAIPEVQPIQINITSSHCIVQFFVPYFRVLDELQEDVETPHINDFGELLLTEVKSKPWLFFQNILFSMSILEFLGTNLKGKLGRSVLHLVDDYCSVIRNYITMVTNQLCSDSIILFDSSPTSVKYTKILRTALLKVVELQDQHRCTILKTLQSNMNSIRGSRMNGTFFGPKSQIVRWNSFLIQEYKTMILQDSAASVVPFQDLISWIQDPHSFDHALETYHAIYLVRIDFTRYLKAGFDNFCNQSLPVGEMISDFQPQKKRKVNCEVVKENELIFEDFEEFCFSTFAGLKSRTNDKGFIPSDSFFKKFELFENRCVEDFIVNTVVPRLIHFVVGFDKFVDVAEQYGMNIQALLVFLDRLNKLEDFPGTQLFLPLCNTLVTHSFPTKSLTITLESVDQINSMCSSTTVRKKNPSREFHESFSWLRLLSTVMMNNPQFHYEEQIIYSLQREFEPTLLAFMIISCLQGVSDLFLNSHVKNLNFGVQSTNSYFHRIANTSLRCGILNAWSRVTGLLKAFVLRSKLGTSFQIEKDSFLKILFFYCKENQLNSVLVIAEIGFSDGLIKALMDIMIMTISILDEYLKTLSSTRSSPADQLSQFEIILSGMVHFMVEIGFSASFFHGLKQFDEVSKSLLERAILLFSYSSSNRSLEKAADVLAIAIGLEWVEAMCNLSSSIKLPIFPQINDIQSCYDTIRRKFLLTVDRQCFSEESKRILEVNLAIKFITTVPNGVDWILVPYLRCLIEHYFSPAEDSFINSIISERILIFEDYVSSNDANITKHFPFIIEMIFIPSLEDCGRVCPTENFQEQLTRTILQLDGLFKISRHSFIRRFYNPLLSSLVLRDFFSASRRSLNLSWIIMRLKDLKLIPLSKASILDDQAFLFLIHYVLISEQVYETQFDDLLNGQLLQLFQYLSEILQVPLSSNTRSDIGAISLIQFCLNAGSYQTLLLSLVWHLGDFFIDQQNGQTIVSPLQQRAVKALQILCILDATKSWTPSHLHSSQTGSKKFKSLPTINWRKAVEENLSLTLSREFLFICSNLLQNEWNQQSVESQCHLLNCLSGMIQLLSSKDLQQFLPKILSITETGLISGNLSVVISATKVIHTVWFHTLEEELKTTGPALVMILISIILDNSEADGDFGVEHLMACNLFSSKFNVQSEKNKPGKGWTKSFQTGLPRMVRIFNESVEEPDIQISRRSLLSVCISFIFDFRRTFSFTHPCILCLPMSELQSMVSEVREELKMKPLHDLMLSCVEFLQHQSKNVRFVALRCCHVVIRERRKDFYEALKVFLDCNEETEISSLFSNLQIELLRMAVTESDLKIQSEIAYCLGEIGVLDAAFYQVPATFNKRDILSEVNTESTTSAATLATLRSSRTTLLRDQTATGDIIEGKLSQRSFLTNLPWITTRIDFGMILLCEYFIPALRLALEPHSQDYPSFAIQRILQALAEAFESSFRSNPAMPEEMKLELQNRNVYELIEPFWSSKYHLQEGAVKSLPIYFPAISYYEWIGLFTKYCIFFMISHTREQGERYPFLTFYHSCSSLVRQHTHLCQFILPYLLLDLALLGCEEKVRGNSSEIKQGVGWIFHELLAICHDGIAQNNILRSQEDRISEMFVTEMVQKELYHQCAQAVFTILDIFYQWMSESLNSLREKKSVKAGYSESNQVDETLTVYQNIDSVFAALNGIINVFPLEILALLSFNVQSFARSLRYLELAALNKSRLMVESATKPIKGADPKSALLHTNAVTSDITFSDMMESFSLNYVSKSQTHQIDENDIQMLTDIFRELEDSDCVIGVSALRRKFNLSTSSQQERYKIVELQGSEDWVNAVSEYDLLQNSREYAVAVLNYQERRASQSQSALLSGHSLLTGDSNSGVELLSNKDIENIQKGKLKCLIELGHLESVLDQYHNAQLKEELKAIVLPYGIEAAWRLEKWDVLDSAISQGDDAFTSTDVLHHHQSYKREDAFQIQLGKIIHFFHHRDDRKFKQNLKKTKLNMHILHELELSYQMVSPTSDPSDLDNQRLKVENFPWKERFDFTSDAFKHRSAVLAVRRFIFREIQSKPLLTQSWLQYYQILLQNHHFATAKYALQNLKHLGINSEILLLKESQLYFSQRQISKAIQLLEPSPINLSFIESLLAIEKEKLRKQLVQKTVKTRRQAAAISPKEASLVEEENTKRVIAYQYFLENELNRALLAEKLLFCTKLFIESQQMNGSAILQRFHVILKLNPLSVLARLELAKYYEYLYADLLNKESYISTTSVQSSSSSISSGTQSRRGGVHLVDGFSSEEEETMKAVEAHPAEFQYYQLYRYMEKAIESYARCLQISDNPNITIELLPKLLTLWLNFTAQTTGLESPAAASGTMKSKLSTNSAPATAATFAGENALQFVQDRINEKLAVFIDTIPANTWFISIQQVVSRIIHINPQTTHNLEKVLLKILLAYPKQCIWYVASLLFSYNQDRKKICRKLLNITYKKLKENRQERDSQMLIDSQTLFPQLIKLAELSTKEKKISFKLDKIVNIHEFLIPTKTVLLHSYQNIYSFTSSVAGATNHQYSYDLMQFCFTQSRLPNKDIQVQTAQPIAHSESNFMFIKQFQESVNVAASKARPKTIVIESLCGKKIKFLCKMEKDGDLRKDVHMMEFNHTVNRLLLQNTESRKRKLRLRTYAVVCLNEECGLLEWVNNTECLRQAIHDSHCYYFNPLLNHGHRNQDRLTELMEGLSFLQQTPLLNESSNCPNTMNTTALYPHITYREVYQSFLEYQAKFEDDIYEMTKAYHSLIYEIFRYQPCLHRWFFERFTDPTLWLEHRNIYVHSAAVWSAVGYIIGLGDRHTENILLDLTNGECVHVDFDCLFDKGLSLAKPEIIPFRLTSNMIDAMGVMGIEGPFRQTLQISLQVLRDNHNTLLNILEPFLRDPTVAWSRSGRAQRSEPVNQQSTSAREASTNPTKSIQETENKKAKEMLLKISDRLKGVYNIIHPHRDRFIRGAIKRGENVPTKGIGPTKEELLPLSVSGQAQKLIEEATAEENLSQLYIGWQPWI